jgi:site-specific DNA recombinase
MTAKRAIIYARVSTDDQRSNYSIPSQVAECKRYIESKGYTLVGNRFVDPDTGQDSQTGIAAFVDDYSSLELSRPALDTAYEYLDLYGFDVVVVYAIDRLDRDPYKLRTHEYGFIKGNAIVEYVNGNYANTPDGQFMKTIISAAAKLDNDWRTERFNRGKRQKARRGLFVAGRAPFGYRINKNSLGGLSVNEDEANTVKWIFNAYVNNALSMYQICNQLNEKGIKPHTGDTWRKSTIARMLSNTAYIGEIFYNKHKRIENKLILRDPEEWIEITTDSIIDLSLFNSAQCKIKENKEYRRKQASRFYLLSGMVICEQCKRPYFTQTGKSEKNRRATDAQVYRHRIRQGHCCNKSISAKKLEPIVWDKIEALLLEPESLNEGYKQALELQKKSNSTQLTKKENLNNKLNKYQQTFQNLTQAYTDPEINMKRAEYIEQRNKILSDIKTIKYELAEIDNHLSNASIPETYESTGRFAKEIKERIKNEKWKPTPENIRHILEILNIKVYLTENGGGIITGYFGNSIGLSSLSY